jgi:hypothetical protein
MIILSGCVKTVYINKPLIVTTYQYKDIWVIDCISSNDADKLIELISSKTSLQIIKISYSSKELIKTNKEGKNQPGCYKVDVFTKDNNSNSGIAYEAEKVNGEWTIKGTYRWSM